MNRIIVYFGYLVIISQVFSVHLPILSNTLMGYSIKYILYYLFILFSISRWCLSLLKQRVVRASDAIIIPFLIGPMIVGLAFGWGVTNVLVESLVYLMPIAVYAWVESNRIDLLANTKTILVVTIIGGLVSVLVALRIIATNIWAAEGLLVRAAGAVDSTLFIGGFIISGTLLFVFPGTGVSKPLCLFAFVFSMIGLLFTQSRTRIVLAILIMIITIVYGFTKKQSITKFLKLLLFISVFMLVVFYLKPDILEQILHQVGLRFSSLTDVNVTSRFQETSEQLNAFLKSPIIGLGWGSRSIYQGMYVHNIFSSLLMQGGLLFSLCFFTWYFGFFMRATKHGEGKTISCIQLICIEIMVAFTILGFSNAGVLQSGAYLTMTFVFICNKQGYKEELLRSKQ